MERAKEIVNSAQRFVVTLEGDPVWIDELDDSSGTATVHSERSGRVSRVPVDRLHEQ
ncbi:H-type small acid-soluble spore protein [Alicyclobacillus sp.]|uniref:H-type small acid-soluble spore protein n=1 Tax=Alicyclobacillus sp. TaxID=61169 RepID=UPI0025BBD0B3|nr:H-type small acid-soluble spore protein [Alicyclobacillus sp.]MCL6517340.1 H-type small acid-soluble spore protein [Alicyclobacillus sp.]